MQSRGPAITRQLADRRTRGPGHLVAELAQPAAHGGLTDRDLPWLEPLVPAPGRRGSDGLLRICVPGLAIRDGAASDLVRFGHGRVVVLAKEFTKFGQTAGRVGGYVLVSDLEVCVGRKLPAGAAPAVDRLHPRARSRVDVLLEPRHRQ